MALSARPAPNNTSSPSFSSSDVSSLDDEVDEADEEPGEPGGDGGSEGVEPFGRDFGSNSRRGANTVLGGGGVIRPAGS